ncbi:MAG: phasin family protein [Myxococcota bacterium]
MAESPLIKKLRARAQDLTGRAAREVLNRGGSRGTDAMGAALRGAQSGRKVMDESTARVLDALGLATRDDLDAVSRRIGRLRKRLQRLIDEQGA